MSKHLSRLGRKRRKKKALQRERRYLHSIEERMMNPPMSSEEKLIAADRLVRAMTALKQATNQPSLTRRILQMTPVTTKETP